MNRRVTFSITATFETAIGKLNRAKIPVFDCKKRGQEFIFSVNDNNTQKVFAIFSKACYNTTIIKFSFLERLKKNLLLRVGLVVGCVLFVALSLVASSFVLKVEVRGSGDYLKNEVVRVLEREHILFSRRTDFKESTKEILRLDGVIFCSMQKRGSVLCVLVEVDKNETKLSPQRLIADCSGTVKRVVAITGTAMVEVGQTVERGDILIENYCLIEGGTIPTLASGFVELEVCSHREFFASELSEENKGLALKSLNIESGDILTAEVQERITEGGYIYLIDFTYLHRLSINLS